LPERPGPRSAGAQEHRQAARTSPRTAFRSPDASPSSRTARRARTPRLASSTTRPWRSRRG
jgi:hypothetical protein